MVWGMKRFSFNKMIVAVTLAASVFLIGYLVGRDGGGDSVSITTQYIENESESGAGRSETPVRETVLPEEHGTRVDLNAASEQELEEIPGIGPVLAERIIDFRQKAGRFTAVEELLQIEGIGEKKFAALKEYVFAG